MSTRRESGPLPADEKARAVRNCPNCGADLIERSCGLVCPEPGCGFSLSCYDGL